MKTSAFVFKGWVLFLMIGLLAGCQTAHLGSKQHMRQFELVKVDAPAPQSAAAVAVVSEEAAETSQEVLDNESTETVSMGGVEMGLEAELLTDGATVTVPAMNRLQRAATQRIVRNAQRQAERMVQGIVPTTTAGIDHSGIRPQKARGERLEQLKQHNERTQIDLLRLILYILVAFLVITVLSMLFKGQLFTIAVLVLLIAGVLYLMGAL